MPSNESYNQDFIINMQYDFTKMQQRAKAKEAKQYYLNIQSQEVEYAKMFDLCIEKANEHGIDAKICNRWKTKGRRK